MSNDDRKLQANIVPFGLRMQPELKTHIEAQAKKNNRSINSEVVYRLETWDELLQQVDIVHEQHLRCENEKALLKSKIEMLEIKLEQEVVILPDDLIQKLIANADLGNETLSAAAEVYLREALRERAVSKRASAVPGDYISFIDERLAEITDALWELRRVSEKNSDPSPG